jgi:predicted phage terminase large subunit-like protein
MIETDDEYNRRKTVDDYLNEVDFLLLNRNGGYIPSEFALKFMNFIKLVNGEKGEENKTPVMHLVMLDGLQTKTEKIANLCYRGSAKTTLFMEYFTMYLAVFGKLPNFGEVSGLLYISDSMDNGVKSARNSIEFRYNNSEFMQYWVPEARFTENYLEFKNRSGHQLGIKMFGAKSGIRGTKIFNQRPVIAVMDDLVSDADSKSQTAMQAIKDTVYSGVQYALHPSRRKMILNGTPFNKGDIVYEAIESGAWKVNVWPICEQFPCKREEFRGAWEDRFTYDYVKTQYESAVKEGNLKSFQQELMLRITSDESRLVQDGDIGWTSRAEILKNKQNYNFYITTDFATSSKQTADYVVISVWAYSQQGDWIWVDGVVERQQMTQTVNDLFKLVEEYDPQGVGVEISGQQQGFVDWLMMEMNNREKYFNLTHQNGKPGIRPATDKLARFNMVVPLFKAGKIKFVEEMKTSRVLGIFLEQLSMVTRDGIKGKDDCVDTVSMLQYMNPWIPSGSAVVTSGSQGKELPREVWGSMDADPGATDESNYGSYMA